MTEQKRHLALVPPSTDAILAEYHAMRKRMLFDPIGRPYDDNHPDESQDGNHRRVLLRDGELIGTVRIDINVPDAAFRLVTIREDLQGCGYGRSLVELSESFARKSGCRRVVVTAGDQSFGFWEKCSYSRILDGRRIIMSKDL
jgi:GNAT superfamily N-acetyltransferase